MSLTFDPREGLIIAPTRLHGQTGDAIVRLAVDTGATGSVINWDILVLLGYDPAGLPGRVQMTTGSGVELFPALLYGELKPLGTNAMIFLCCATHCRRARQWTASWDWISFAGGA